MTDPQLIEVLESLADSIDSVRVIAIDGLDQYDGRVHLAGEILADTYRLIQKLRNTPEDKS